MSEEFDAGAAAARAMGEATDLDVGEAVDGVQEASDDGGGAGEPAVPDAAIHDDSSNVGSLWDWLLEPASKSHREVDAGDFFDLEHGGRNRLALVASDYLGSKYPPRLYQLTVGAIEEALGFADGLDVEEGQPELSSDDQEASDDDTSVPLTDVEGV